jgi:DNA polymerase-3 subunit beta
MKFTITRSELLKGLQFIAGVIERRQSMPILANVLLDCQQDKLSLIGSNLEMELTGKVKPLVVTEPGSVTVSGRKLMDICRVLPDDSQIVFQFDGEKAVIQAGKSRFQLGTLPVADFPLTAIDEGGMTIAIPEAQLLKLLETTHFAMAEQDVRYYLNGLFLELSASNKGICAVATDGHRLALDFLPLNNIEGESQFILPRKGALELLRLLNKDSDANVELRYVTNAIRLSSPDFVVVSRLIEGRYPDYHRVIPKNGDKIAYIARDNLKQLLQRVAILTNENHRAALLRFERDVLSVSANNAEQEEVQDELEIDYPGESMEIAFNVTYLLDVLQVLPDSPVKIIFSTGENGILVESEAMPGAAFVIMPMSL